MNKIKIIITVIVLSVMSISCSTQDDGVFEKENINVSELLSNKYNLERIDNQTANYSKKNFKNIENYQFKDNKNQQIIILQNIQNTNQYLVIKGELDKFGFSVSKEILVDYELNNEKDGIVKFNDLQNNRGFISNFIGGKPIDKDITNLNTNYQLKKSSLCQREGDETFKECFDRESDEFQDDFISTVAYITNPTIPLLIASLCTC